MSRGLIKNLIIVLIGLNVFYFIWAFAFGSGDKRSLPPLDEKIPTLVLLPSTGSDAYQSSKASRESSCYTFGPFNSKKTAKDIAKKINNFGLATEINKQKTMQTLNFLVYLQALPSRKEALDVIKDISKHEIKNYRLIETGPYKNAIALGSFNDLDEARRHTEYIRFLGYDAKHTRQKKQKEVYWIDYDEPFGSNAPVMRWSKQIDERTSAQKIPKKCQF